MLKAAVGKVSIALWGAGALPSVAHGAAVAGICCVALRELRLLAADLNGAPGRSHTGVAACLISRKNEFHDPTYHATLAIVVKFAEW
eukprot:5916827-Pyramimonas_sp.AAC.1